MSLKTQLQAGDGCLSIERLGEPLTAAERAHVDGCARCEAELALWQQFNEAVPAPDEGAAVRWITSELRRRLQPARTEGAGARWHKVFQTVSLRPALGLAAAAALAVVVISSVARDPEPAVGETSGEQVYRSAAVRVIAPTGDLDRVPSVLEWTPFPDVSRYDVELLEVDRTRLWRTTTREPRVALPKSVIDKIVPGKTLLWEVAALDGSGKVLGTSGPQRFRVRVSAPSGSR